MQRNTLSDIQKAIEIEKNKPEQKTLALSLSKGKIKHFTAITIKTIKKTCMFVLITRNNAE